MTPPVSALAPHQEMSGGVLMLGKQQSINVALQCNDSDFLLIVKVEECQLSEL